MARLFWYPQGAPLKKLDLAQEFSEITENEVRDEVVHESISGRRTKIVYSSRVTVRVISELITDQTDALDLDVLCNYLRRGGTISVAEDGTRTLGAFLRRAPARGDTQLTWYPNLFSGFGGAITPTSGEEFYLRGPSPKCLREYVVANVGTSSGTSLSTAPLHDWTGEPWVFVHNRYFWPFLRLSPGAVNAQLLRSTRRIHYTLDLPLEESPDALARISEAPSDIFMGEIEEHGKTTFERPPSSTGPEPILQSPFGTPAKRTGWWSN